LAPSGGHVPTDSEWSVLTTYLGGEGVPGGKLKEAGTAHWLSPNTGATNETGFTALPGGYRIYSGAFNDVGSNGYWWSATAWGAATSGSYSMSYSNAGVNHANYYDDRDGFSVRCVKNP
jgi:uncharacterized protein (TIGR02145 family)